MIVGKWVARIPPGYEDLPEQDIKKRQAMWAEQQDIRSSRVIYTLQQQVKAIQADLAKVKGPFTQKDRVCVCMHNLKNLPFQIVINLTFLQYFKKYFC